MLDLLPRTLDLIFKLFTDQLQFFTVRLIRLRVTHPEFFQRVEDNLGDNQTGVLLIVGGNYKPRRFLCACRTQARLVRLLVMIPKFPLFNVSQA